MRSEEPYAQKLQISKIGGRILITEKHCPAQAGRSNFEHRSEKNAGYFLITNGSEDYTISVAPESQKYVFYSDEGKGRLCQVLGTEEVRVVRGCVFFGHGNV